MSTWRVMWLVLHKELLEVRRDARTLVLLIAVPALLYPLLLVGAASMTQGRLKSVDAQPLRIAIPHDAPVALQLALTDAEKVTVVRSTPGVEQPAKGGVDVHARVVPAAIEETPRSWTLLTDSSQEGGRSAARRLRPVLQAYAQQQHEHLLASYGVDAADLVRGTVDVVDVAPPAKKTGFLLSRLIVPLLIVMLLLGAFYPAIEMTSGERERSTLVTLLATPVSPVAIAGGKFFAVALLSLTAAMANLVGMGLTSLLGLSVMPAFSIPLSTLALVVVVIVPLALYTSALLLAASTLAQTTKEAQTYLTPLFLVLSLPAVAAVLPGVHATTKSALIPIFGPALVLREILAEQATPSLILAGLGGALAVIVVAVGLAARAFSVEAILTGRVQRPLRLDGPLELFDAVLLSMTVAVGFFVVGTVVGSRVGVLPSLWASQVGVFFLIPVVVVALRCRRPADVLGWRRPQGKALFPLLIVGGWPAIAALGEWLGRTLFTVDESLIEQMKVLAKSLDGQPEWLLFVSLAVLPAVCEETAFRGALLSAAKRPWVGVVVVAVLFAASHGALVRAPITFGVGVLAGALRVSTGSLWPAVGLHVLHNGFALVLAAGLGDVDPASSPPTYTGLPMWMLALSTLSVVAAVAVGLRQRHSEER